MLGGLWNSTDVPPDPDAATSGGTARWSFTSRKGTRVTLHDDPTEKVEVTVASASGAPAQSRAAVSIVSLSAMMFR